MAQLVVGAQLIIFSKTYNMEHDIDVVLDSLQMAGYAAIEGSIKDPVALKRKLDAHGMKHAAQHTIVRPLLENPQGIIDYLNATGASDVCNSGFLDWKHSSIEEVRSSIKLLNEAGRKLAAAGIKLHYHNHDFEFSIKYDGKRIIDILLEELDPAACDLCVDVAWVMRSGDDPASFLKKNAARIGYLHVKDWDGAKWVELGKGKVDFKSILPVLPALTKVKWIMVEQDLPDGDPMQNMANSRKYLKEVWGL
jgi:sugar phosphate isomerase/epimerase